MKYQTLAELERAAEKNESMKSTGAYWRYRNEILASHNRPISKAEKLIAEIETAELKLRTMEMMHIDQGLHTDAEIEAAREELDSLRNVQKIVTAANKQ